MKPFVAKTSEKNGHQSRFKGQKWPKTVIFGTFRANFHWVWACRTSKRPSGQGLSYETIFGSPRPNIRAPEPKKCLKWPFLVLPGAIFTKYGHAAHQNDRLGEENKNIWKKIKFWPHLTSFEVVLTPFDPYIHNKIKVSSWNNFKKSLW